MNLILITQKNKLPRKNRNSDVFYSSLDSLIISEIIRRGLNYFDLSESIPKIEFVNSSLFAIKYCKQISVLSKGKIPEIDLDLKGFLEMIYLGDCIGKVLINYGIKTLTHSISEVSILKRSGPQPLDQTFSSIFYNSLILSLIKHDESFTVSKFKRKRLVFESIRNRIKILTTPRQQISHKILVFDDLIYPSEIAFIEESYDFENIQRLNLSQYRSIYKRNSEFDDNSELFENLYFSEISYDLIKTNLFKRQLNEIFQESRLANQVACEIISNKRVKKIFFGFDGFTLESMLCKHLYNSDIETYSFVHYGVIQRGEFYDNISNPYSKELLWNKASIDIINPLTIKKKTPTILGAVRYRNYKVSKFQFQAEGCITILTAKIQNGLKNFNISYSSHIRELRHLFNTNRRLNFILKNHPSFDDHQLYRSMARTFDNVKIKNNLSVEQLVKFTKVFLLFNYNTTAAIEAILSGGIVIMYFSNETNYDLKRNNFMDKSIPLFRNLTTMSEFILTISNESATLLRNKQLKYVEEFIGTKYFNQNDNKLREV